MFFIDGVVRVKRTFCHYSLRNLAKNRFDPLDALTYTLIFDTTPVAFGALGIPVTTLAAITGLPVMKLSAMMGRQLPLLSLFLPSYALIFYAGKFYFMIKCTILYFSRIPCRILGMLASCISSRTIVCSDTGIYF